ncbi:hypothetical protein [Bradyrhizobium tunisiense]|uniref:hypothetical protein n=1 Tax=Bradyrhizobium tunisiense TaxID=3278709 RepID=UPI0035D58669
MEGADAFFEHLKSLVSAQTAAQQPNPRSVELMVSSAKKFPARPEFRIHLDELIGGEVRLIDQGMTANNGHPRLHGLLLEHGKLQAACPLIDR